MHLIHDVGEVSKLQLQLTQHSEIFSLPFIDYPYGAHCL